MGDILNFIIYINDFSNNIKTDTTIFAEDTTLLCSGNDKEDLKANMINNPCKKVFLIDDVCIY